MIFATRNNKGADQTARMRRLVCTFLIAKAGTRLSIMRKNLQKLDKVRSARVIINCIFGRGMWYRIFLKQIKNTDYPYHTKIIKRKKTTYVSLATSEARAIAHTSKDLVKCSDQNCQSSFSPPSHIQQKCQTLYLFSVAP